MNEDELTEELKELKKEVRDLREFMIKTEASHKARSGLVQMILRYWPGVLALLAIGVELKRMKP
jgi:DNA-binding protein YbaB